MYALDDLTTILDEVELLFVEMGEWNAHGPHFTILHRYHKGGPCAPHEEVAAVYLMHRGREFRVRLGTALRLLFDYLARHTRLPQSAGQIERGTREDRFYARPGPHKGRRTRKCGIPHSSVRCYIERIVTALGGAFADAGLAVDPRKVLVAEPTVTNEVGYRLRATVEWLHSAL